MKVAIVSVIEKTPEDGVITVGPMRFHIRTPNDGQEAAMLEKIAEYTVSPNTVSLSLTYLEVKS